MKRLFVVLLLLGGAAQAASAGPMADSNMNEYGLERVNRMSLLGGIDSWSRVDDDSVIVWVTPFKPYLVDLTRKARDLRFANTIAVTSSAGAVHGKFDSVIVDGIRYPIKSIYKLDRAAAKKMRRRG